MKPEEIAPLNAPSGKIERTYEHLYKPAPASEAKIKAPPKADKVKPPQLDHVQFNKLEASNNDSRDIALEIRRVNQSLESIDANLQKMQSALEGIVKIYPPYPPGSSERVEALRQFSTLRKMIDQIAQPHRINSLQNILGDPARNPRSGDWTIATDHRETNMVIRHQPVHPGRGGLELPDINIDSSDAQITAAISRTTSAMQSLNSKRQSFIADANRAISKII